MEVRTTSFVVFSFQFTTSFNLGPAEQIGTLGYYRNFN